MLMRADEFLCLLVFEKENSTSPLVDKNEKYLKIPGNNDTDFYLKFSLLKYCVFGVRQK